LESGRFGQIRPTVLVGIFRRESGRSAVLAKWSECDQFGRQNLGWPDSSDIDLMLLDFGDGRLLERKGQLCRLKWVECVWRL